MSKVFFKFEVVFWEFKSDDDHVAMSLTIT